MCFIIVHCIYFQLVTGGLGFDPAKIGMVLGITAVPMLLLNLYIFPFLVRKFGLKKVGIQIHLTFHSFLMLGKYNVMKFWFLCPSQNVLQSEVVKLTLFYHGSRFME